jgi:hypothetical protein
LDRQEEQDRLILAVLLHRFQDVSISAFELFPLSQRFNVFAFTVRALRVE